MERAEYADLAARHWNQNVKGKTNPYTSINGNMFSFLDKGGNLAVRLSPQQRAAHNKAHDLGPVMQYGAVMKDYVWVPEAVVGDANALDDLLQNAMEFAKSLKPKPAKKEH